MSIAVPTILEKDKPRRLIIRGLSHDYKRILSSLIKRAIEFSEDEKLAGAEEAQVFYKFFEVSALTISDQLDQIGDEIYREDLIPATTILTRHKSALERNFDELVADAERLQFQIVLSAGPNQPIQKEALAFVEQVRRARRQIDALLLLPFKEHDLRYRKVNIRSEVTKIIADLYSVFDENGSDPKDSVDIVASATIYCDQTMFSIAVSNVIANAAVHAQRKSELRISITEEKCQNTADPKWIDVVIDDNGPGIAPEDRSAIFQLFKQGKEGVASEKGSGVGLTFAKMAMETLGGSLTLRETPGKHGGAAFVLRFPNS